MYTHSLIWFHLYILYFSKTSKNFWPISSWPMRPMTIIARPGKWWKENPDHSQTLMPNDAYLFWSYFDPIFWKGVTGHFCRIQGTSQGAHHCSSLKILRAKELRESSCLSEANIHESTHVSKHLRLVYQQKLEYPFQNFAITTSVKTVSSQANWWNATHSATTCFCWRRIYGPVELACFYHTCWMLRFGTYFTHAQTCNATRVQSATEWTASVHTLHMPKHVM